MSSQYFTEYTWTAPNDNIVVSTSSVEEVPSNKKPFLNLTVNGFLKKSNEIYELQLKFQGGVGPSKNQIAGCYGTFCFQKRCTML